MTTSDTAFILEFIEARYDYRFKSKKFGLTFWLTGTNKQLPAGEIGFTVEEFAHLGKCSHDELAAILAAKSQFVGSTITNNAVEANKNAVPFESKKQNLSGEIKKLDSTTDLIEREKKDKVNAAKHENLTLW